MENLALTTDAQIIFSELVKRYANSEVVSGEFIIGETFSPLFAKEDVKAGVAEFLKWDESPQEFVIKKIDSKWTVIEE